MQVEELEHWADAVAHVQRVVPGYSQLMRSDSTKAYLAYLRVAILGSRLLVAQSVLILGRLWHRSTSTRSRSLTSWVDRLLLRIWLGTLRIRRLRLNRYSASVSLFGSSIRTRWRRGTRWWLLLNRRYWLLLMRRLRSFRWDLRLLDLLMRLLLGLVQRQCRYR